MPKRQGSGLLRRLQRKSNLTSMRIVNPLTGKSYLEKRRRRFNQPGQPRELTFSCFHRYAFLARDRARNWFRDRVAGAEVLRSPGIPRQSLHSRRTAPDGLAHSFDASARVQ